MICSRLLSRTDFAAWGLFMLVVYFIEMGRSGLLQNGLMRFTATHREDRIALDRMQTAALLLNLFYAFLTSVILLATTGWLAKAYEVPALAGIVPIYIATNFVLVALSHSQFVQQAHLEFRGLFWGTFWYRGGLFVWLSGCWVLGRPLVLQEMAWVQGVGALLGAFVCVLLARPWLPSPATLWHNLRRWADIRKSAFHFLIYGRYVLGTNISAMFYKNIDKLTLGGILGPSAFAVYDVAGKITQMIEAPSFSIAAVVFPQSAHRAISEGREGVKRLYERSVGAILALILPFLVFTLVFAEWIVHFLAGAQYADAAHILRLTAFFGLFMPFAVQFGTVLDSTGHPGTNFQYTLATAVLNLALNYLFVKTLGLYGAAFATLTGYAISFVFMQRLLFQRYGIVWWKAFESIPLVYKMAWGVLAHKIKKNATFAP
jgi:O-antigen/teichoic acid export membrane protein